MIKILPLENKKRIKPYFLVEVETMVGNADYFPEYKDKFDKLNFDDEIIIKVYNNINLTDDEADRYDLYLADGILNARNRSGTYSKWEEKWADLLYHYDERSDLYEEIEKIKVSYFDEDNNEHKVEIL